MKTSKAVFPFVLVLVLLTACSGGKKETLFPSAETQESVTPAEEATSDPSAEKVPEEQPESSSAEETSTEEASVEEPAEDSVEESVEESSEEPVEEPAAPAILSFGSYEQDDDPSNGAEPIEWIILQEEEDRILLLSLHALDSASYNEGLKDTTWETCALRSFLNGAFYDTAFTDEEKEKVLPVTNENPDSNGYFLTEYALETYTQLDYTEEEIREKGALGGNPTEDRVFCLSWEEVLPYLDAGLLNGCTPTAYAVGQGAWSGDAETGEASHWWLRSPGGEQYQVFYMNHDGALRYVAAGGSGYCIRPAIWISK